MCPKGVYPLERFLQYLAFGRESQVRTLIPNFTVLAFRMWAYSLKNRNFWYKFIPIGKFWGFIEKVEYRCTTTNIPLCNGALTVLKIILLHSVSVITNFVIPKAWQTDIQKTSHFLVYSRRATHDPYHTWHGGTGGPSRFCNPLTFLIQSFRR